MEAVTGIIIEGVKNFGGEIVGGVLLAVALWVFPGLRKFFGRDKGQNDNDTEAETRRQLEILQQEERQLAHLREILQRHDEALKLTETQTAEEIRRKSEIQRHLEEQRKEEERVKAEILCRQEELRQAEEKRAEEARREAELARQLEDKRREEERIRAEIQRRQEELRQAEARQREEAQRQLEAMRKSSGAQLGYIRGFAWITILLSILLWAFTDSSHRAKITPNNNVSHTIERRNFAFKSQSKKIVSRYLEAAEQGHADAQYILGLTYEYGLRYNHDDAIPKNLNEARKWYQKAAKQGYRAAQQALERLK